MKIACLYNTNNTAYYLVKFLRMKGIDAELIIDQKSFVNTHPAWETGLLNVNKTKQHLNLPYYTRHPKWKSLNSMKSAPWIHYIKGGNYLGFKGPSFIKLIRMLRKYEIIQAYHNSIRFAQFTFKPYIAVSSGDDLREQAFRNNFQGRLFRRGFKNAKYVITQTPDLLESAKRLKLKKATFIPPIIDVEKYRPVDTKFRKKLQNSLKCDFVIFCPARHDWMLKGNDKLLKAYERFTQEHKKSVLVLVNWGNDIEKSKTLIDKLDIGKNIIIRPMMNKNELIKYYNASDIITDQFNSYSLAKYMGLSITALEAMSCSKPVITDFEPNRLYKKYYQETPPILSATSEEQIFDRLVELSNNTSRRKKIGHKSRKWVQKYHHWKKICNKHIKLYESILEGDC